MNDVENTHPKSAKIPFQEFHSLENALRENERTAVFIDGANCHGTIKALGFQLDWRKFWFLIHNMTQVMGLNYYSALNQEDDGTIHLKKLLDFIEYNGYTMVTKFAKRIKMEDDTIRVKGNMDVELVLDVMQALPNLDHVILFTGDGDFTALLQYVQKQGKKASVISSYEAHGASVSDSLRRTATHFIELAYFKNKIMLERELSEGE